MLLLAAPHPAGPIVVVEDRVAHESSDGGRTFHPILRAGVDESIFDAAIAADGTFYALRGDSLDIVRAGYVSTIARHDARRVAVSGTVVALLASSTIDLSTDGGRTFVTRPIPLPCPDCPNELDMFDFTIVGGSPYLVDTSINTCTSVDLLEWQRLVQTTPRATFQRSLAIPERDYAAHWHFGAYGWMYGLTYAHRVLAVSSAGAQPVEGIPTTTAAGDVLVAHDDRVTVAMIGDALYQIDGARAHVLDAHTKGGDLLAVDGDDRPLVSDGKVLWRFSRISGWTRLAMP